MILRRAPSATPSRATAATDPRDERGDRGEERRVGRLRPALEDQRPEAAAEDRPERETGHREEADDESLPRAPEGERDRESDYAPVQDGHGQRA